MPPPYRRNRKQATSAVEFLDDLPLSDPRAELFAGRRVVAEPSVAGNGHGGAPHSSASECTSDGRARADGGGELMLAAELEAEAQRGLDLLADARGGMAETVAVADATARALHAQSEQLCAIRGDLEEASDNVEAARPVVDSLTRNALVRLLCAPVDLPRRRLERAARTAARRRRGVGVAGGGGGGGGDGGGGSGVVFLADDREDVGKAREQRGLGAELARRDRDRVSELRLGPPQSAPDAREKYDEYKSATVRSALVAQDDHLDHLYSDACDLRQLAVAMDVELQYQHVVINSIDTDEVTQRIRTTRNQLRRAK